MKYRLCFVVGVACLLTLIGACDRKSKYKGFDKKPIEYFDNCVSYEFDINALPYDEMHGNTYSLNSIYDTAAPKDNEGVIMFNWEGRDYYHPGVLFRISGELIAAFRDTHDSAFMELLDSYLNRLLKESMEVDGALYFPIPFDYYVNQQEDGFLKAPWFSGMTQGQALGIFVRTYLITQDSIYINLADKVFKSFLRLHGESEPWTVFIDSQGCYWIEEYTTWEPSRTLNGFIYAIYGLYDYYRLTADDRAADILIQSLSTIKNYIPLYRRPGKPSYYGLRFGHYAANYHKLHIEQLRYLEKMTGDPFFGNWADTLESDFNE